MSQQSPAAPAKPTFPPNDPVTRAMTAVDGKGGGNETGPYDVVANWPQNYCGDGFVIGATAGILAESPDRVFIFSRGCLPALQDTRTPAENFIPAAQRRQLRPVAGRRVAPSALGPHRQRR